MRPHLGSKRWVGRAAAGLTRRSHRRFRPTKSAAFLPCAALPAAISTLRRMRHRRHARRGTAADTGHGCSNRRRSGGVQESCWRAAGGDALQARDARAEHAHGRARVHERLVRGVTELQRERGLVVRLRKAPIIRLSTQKQC